MALEFLETVYPFVFILVGIIGIIMGFNRLIKSDEEESTKLKFMAAIAALILFALILLMIWDGRDVTNYSYFFSFLFSLSIAARPLKKIPFAFLAAVIIGLTLFYLAMNKAGDIEVLGNLSLQVIVIAIVGLVVLVFIIGFFQEAVMDGFLMVLGWSPIVLILSLSLIAQGISLILGINSPDGILGYLPL